MVQNCMKNCVNYAVAVTEQGATADLNKDGNLNAVDFSLLKRILL